MAPKTIVQPETGGVADWLQSLQECSLMDRGYNAADVERVLGDPRKGVEVLVPTADAMGNYLTRT